MNLTDAVSIFESFYNWVSTDLPKTEYTCYSASEVLEAQSIILNEAKQNLAFEMSVLSKNERLIDSEK